MTERARELSLEEALASIPAEWTAWELRSRARRTLFVCTISRLDPDEDEVFEWGHGDTPARAVLNAIAKARGSDTDA